MKVHDVRGALIASCASVGALDDAALLLAAGQSNRDWLEQAAQRDAQVLARFPGADELLAHWRALEPQWSIDWHPAFGPFSNKNLQHDTAGAAAWLSLLTHLSFHLPEARWSASLETNQIVRHHHTILYGFKEIAAIDGMVKVKLSDGWRSSDAMPQTSWIEWRRDAVDLYPLDCWRALTGDEIGAAPTDGYLANEDDVNRFCNAINLLELLPDYAAWVRKVLRTVVFLDAAPGVTMSSSDDRSPSTVRMTIDDNPANGAELLVHECAHIYLAILERQTDLIGGADQTLYYSPFRKAGRPLRSILLGYHAFANIAAMYRELVKAGYHPQAMISQFSAVLEQLQPLDMVLSNAEDITPCGRAFYKQAAATAYGQSS